MEFANFANLVSNVNNALGEFCNDFGNKRKQLAGLGKTPKKGILFSFDKDRKNNWAINEGGGTEVQYHIAFNVDKLKIVYGIGFNTKYVPYANKMSPVEYMRPFMKAYLAKQNTISQLLPDYGFINGSIELLKNPVYDEYVLLGKSKEVKKRNDNYFLDDNVFTEIIADLKKQFEAYQIIFNEKNNLKKVEMSIQNSINILQQKKQIILQGPPGTGKTREAKLIAEQICADFKLNITHKAKILEAFQVNQKLKTIEGNEFTIENITETSFQLKISSDKPYTVSIDQMIRVDSGENLIKSSYSYAPALIKHAKSKILEDQIKLVQFHPAYSYEDFVRGIVVKTDNSSTPEYKTINKILGEFAKKANESNLSGGVDDFDRAWYELVQDINDNKIKKIGSSDVEVDINTEGNIRFKSPVATYEKTYELYRFGKTDLKYETYNRIVLNFLKDKSGKYKLKDFISPSSISSNKPYVLIIDEINRANLPAVLGELIYAMEYRGEKVESLYSTIEEGNTLILPPNLYIIGTMNTADRSVGHIDYAIRRRFAFIDLLPKIIEGDAFELESFKKVSSLFIKNVEAYANDATVALEISEHLSDEFRPEDVWLGHSYFIKTNVDFELRKKYEIIPILKEYIKDGVLKSSAEKIINDL